jgi:hypothetical protein
VSFVKYNLKAHGKKALKPSHEQHLSKINKKALHRQHVIFEIPVMTYLINYGDFLVLIWSAGSPGQPWVGQQSI